MQINTTLVKLCKVFLLHYRILKLARTIADLEESKQILTSHVAEAVNYSNLDREGLSG